MIKMNYTKVTLCLGTVLLLLICGCTQEEPSATPSDSPTKIELCSNEKYSTRYISMWTVSSKPSLVGLASSKQNIMLKEAFSMNGNKAFEEIKDLTCLEELSLGNSEVSDISKIDYFPNLMGLSLQSTKVVDLSPLKKLSKLEYLDIGKSKVLDISPLQGMESLRYVLLSDTSVSDISPLMGLKNLKQVQMENSKVSPEDCEALKLALPNTDIYC